MSRFSQTLPTDSRKLANVGRQELEAPLKIICSLLSHFSICNMSTVFLAKLCNPGIHVMEEQGKT